ncbi:glycine betaine ABC transporter substrate-binding protein [soil metagenome]|jgi:glycine betaine/proline transport system substrate-binding protein
MKVSGKLSALTLALLVGVLAVGCGGGGDVGSKSLKLGVAGGWDENIVIANLTKVLLEDELGYDSVEIQTLGLDLVFEGVGNGELDAFQDVWLPNHEENLSEVEDNVVKLDNWYLGQTEFGIAVPTYVADIASIPELNQTNIDQILGIEPGAVIMERIPEETIPAYDLNQSLVESSTQAMLSEVESRYSNQEPFAFVAWRPHWMNQVYEFKYLEDPEDTLGKLNDSSEISSIVNEDVPDEHPVAYAFMQELTLTEEQVNEIEVLIRESDDDAEAGVRDWLEDNREAVEPWIEAANAARES